MCARVPFVYEPSMYVYAYFVFYFSYAHLHRVVGRDAPDLGARFRHAAEPRVIRLNLHTGGRRGGKPVGEGYY